MLKINNDNGRIVGKILKYIATIITLTVSTFFVQSCVRWL